MSIQKQLFLSLIFLLTQLLCFTNMSYANNVQDDTQKEEPLTSVEGLLQPVHTLLEPVNDMIEYAKKTDIERKQDPKGRNKTNFQAGLVYFQPDSDNLKYAVFVSGIQPYYQSWHYQAVNPAYSPGFRLAYEYAFPESVHNATLDWLHLNTSDSAFKQANRNTDLKTVEFVGPPFEMSPPVFAIKRAESNVNFQFDSILIDVGRLIDFTPALRGKIFGGINLLRVNQTITTTFSDNAGSPATPYSYALDPDPAYSFELKNTSKFFGVGPNLGINAEYMMDRLARGFGIVGQVVGSVTVGSLRVNDAFTSTSTRLNDLGIGTSHQQITAPNATQVVPGADGKLGLFYEYEREKEKFVPLQHLTFELGYRIAAYLNAIGSVNPNTIVQAGLVTVTPEFATGTMAIVSTDSRSRPFNFNGPYLDVKVLM